MVKVGDKFLPPRKVSLPIGWHSTDPTEVLNTEYDFTLEKQALSLAESERRAKELRELQEASIDSDLNSNLNGILQSKPAEELSVSDLRTSSAELDNSVKNCEEDGGSSLTPLSAILTPIPLDAASVIAKNENSRSQPAFSLSEFEDDNVTPFELVELQTMNDIDELKSVLQPNAGSVPNGPSHPKHIMNRAKAQEIDYSFFTPLKTEPKTAIVEAGTANIALLIDTTASVSAASSASRPPLQALESTISVSLPSSLQVLASTDSISPSPFLQSSVSTSLTSQPDFSFNYNARGITPAPHSQPYSMNRNNINHLVDMDYVDMRSANSTNLTSTNSKSLPNLAQEGLITSNGELESFPHPDQNQDFAQPDSFVPTARISNIMQQYQFTRFTENEMNSSQRNNPDLGPVETVQDIPGLGPRPISRHGALPPMGHTPVPLTPSGRKTPPSNLSKTPPGASSFLTDGGGVPILPPWTSRSTHVLQSRMTPEALPNSVAAESNQGVNVRKLSSPRPLPPISPAPLSPPEISGGTIAAKFAAATLKNNLLINPPRSWLPDLTTKLPPQDRNFAIMLSGMGFPLPRVARTVERLGKDEKEATLCWRTEVVALTELNHDSAVGGSY